VEEQIVNVLLCTLRIAIQNRSSKLPPLEQKSQQVIIEVDADDPNDGYVRTRRPHRFLSRDRDPKMFNRGTEDVRRQAVDDMIRALAVKAELDQRQEEEARQEEARRRTDMAKRRIRSLQRQVERGQPLEPSQQAMLGYYTAMKSNMDNDDKMARNVLDMLLHMTTSESKFKHSLESVLRNRGIAQ